LGESAGAKMTEKSAFEGAEASMNWLVQHLKDLCQTDTPLVLWGYSLGGGNLRTPVPELWLRCMTLC
jgi:predicted alpha/beta-fold hydrolase